MKYSFNPLSGKFDISSTQEANWGDITGTLSNQTDLQNVLDNKQDILTEGAFVDGDKTKLNGIEDGAEVNVNADWNAVSGDAEILNKPNLTQYLKKDGSTPLISDWDIGDGRKIQGDEIAARDSAGLKLYDDAGNGIFVEDGGNVGIGTTGPERKLYVQGGINSGILLKQGAGISTDSAEFYNGLTLENPSTSHSYSLGYYEGGGLGINYHDGDTTYTNRMIITNSGNVGINTNDPKTNLDINGSVKTSYLDEECNADKEGAQRYSPDQQAMNYCDGSQWRQYNTPGCPATVEDADGNTYKTVQIGDQCWMAENLNVGEMATSEDTGVTHSDVSDNGTIEKYCYGNDPANCETDGGLYDWNEAMQYTTTEGAQGICPAGWHIPTDEEWKTLEMQLGMSQTEADLSGWRGTDEGDKLKVPDQCEGGENCNASLFVGLLAGNRLREGPFGLRGASAYFWSSSESSSSLAWRRTLYGDSTEVYRNPSYKECGFSVRCLKD